MSALASPFLDQLQSLAHAAQREEISFRENVAREIARRERDRQFAFRRLDLARTMASVATTAKTEDEAIERQRAALIAELGWFGATDFRARALDAWIPVAQAVWEEVRPSAGGSGDSATTADAAEIPEDGVPSVHVAMRTFEAWYETETGQTFLAILDHEIPEIPVVEF